MLKFYRIRVECFKNGELYGNAHYLTAFTDEVYPDKEEFEITWDNLEEVYKRWNVALPFSYFKFKKGRLVSNFECSPFNRNTWDIKEWKHPKLGLTLRVAFKELIPTMYDLRYENAERVVRYFSERYGISSVVKPENEN